MPDTETKKRIDNARDILVGKVPDPKSQVEQITIALIYKFMDDMDKEGISFGGKAMFFTGEYEKYSWSNVYNPKVGGFEMLNLYSEAILKLNQNPGIPQLFRDIFKNAYLPYRDPETLKLFLKEINVFNYDHSEKLGDAFEYLLSVLGSQGDAGQFRTPRHIIDFIVEVLQPKKNESVCDPACGTAGFLISSYKHIVKQNTKKNIGDLLTPDDRKKLMQNFVGYDISPDMVRLSLVNLYLHSFTTPKIYEYDTLTSEDRWNEYFDVILANPPFMSPKGGIKPHKKFTIQANRSEVLFVDYIAEHIHPSTGRAGIIVPEGIIFQSANAYKALRKMLVEKNFLYAVVSLPGGIFQPYSGVKTSILLMDKTLAKKTDKILFVKIDNEGYDLGAQRREIDKNDLPEAVLLLQQYKQSLQNNTVFESNNKNVFFVDKEIIAEKDEFNLSIDRYRVNAKELQSNFEIVSLGKITEFIRGVTYGKEDEVFVNGLKILRANNINVESGKIDFSDIKQISKSIKLSEKQKLKANDIFICTASGSASHIGKVAFINNDIDFFFGGFMGVIRCKGEVLPKYLFYQLRNEKFNIHLNNSISGANIKNLKSEILNSFSIPLPPISIQQQIVSKIESFQKIIDGAKQVVVNYKPQIEIDVSWEMVKLKNVCDLIRGITFGKKDQLENETSDSLRVATTKAAQENGIVEEDLYFVPNKFLKDEEKLLREGDILISTANSLKLLGRTTYVPKLNYTCSFGAFMSLIRANRELILPVYLLHCLKNEKAKKYFELNANTTTNISNLSFDILNSFEIPVPPLSIQQEIVNRIEKEQQLVNANKELIKIYEQKIKDEINKLWQTEPKQYAETEEKINIAAEK